MNVGWKIEEIDWTLTLEQRVDRGIAWLDEVRPSWWQELDLARLDLGSGCNCVLGQIVSYECSKDWDGVEQETLDEVKSMGFDVLCDVREGDDWFEYLLQIDNLAAVTLTNDEAVNRGFHVCWFDSDHNQRRSPDVKAEFDLLTALWEAEVRARRAA